MKGYGGVHVYIFLISPQAGGQWSASRTDRFNPGERAACTLWVGSRVDPRSGLDDLETVLVSTGTRTLNPQLSSP
jgi:hypothetical protein